MLKHKEMDKEIVDKIKELKTKKKEERRSKRVESTFTQAEEHFKGELRRIIELNSIMHHLLLLLGLLVKDSTTI